MILVVGLVRRGFQCFRSLPSLLILLAVAGCASDDASTPEWAGVKSADEPAELVEFTETADFEIRWQTDVGSSGANILQPALSGDVIYAASVKGNLSKLDKNTGKIIWQVITGLDVSGGVGSGEGLAILGGKKGDVLAFDESGEIKWESKVSSEVLSVSQVTDGMVVVRSGDGRMTGLSADDGKQVWIFERSTPALVVRSHASVSILHGVAFAGFAGGRLAAIRLSNGEVLWETSVSQPRGNTELERISDITGNPVVDNEQVCAVAFQGRMACYDTVQGSPLWNRELSSDQGMMLLRRYLYLSDSKSAVTEMDKTTGNTVWKNAQLFMRGISSPYVMEDFVIVGDRLGYLHGLSRDDGAFVARTELKGGKIKATMLKLGDGFLVQTRGGEIYSLAIKSREAN
ncbi:MAG: outer membrane protein assembly factor BamB [Gallionella sp.]